MDVNIFYTREERLGSKRGTGAPRRPTAAGCFEFTESLSSASRWGLEWAAACRRSAKPEVAAA